MGNAIVCALHIPEGPAVYVSSENTCKYSTLHPKTYSNIKKGLRSQQLDQYCTEQGINVLVTLKQNKEGKTECLGLQGATTNVYVKCAQETGLEMNDVGDKDKDKDKRVLVQLVDLYSFLNGVQQG